MAFTLWRFAFKYHVGYFYRRPTTRSFRCPCVLLHAPLASLPTYRSASTSTFAATRCSTKLCHLLGPDHLAATCSFYSLTLSPTCSVCPFSGSKCRFLHEFQPALRTSKSESYFLLDSPLRLFPLWMVLPYPGINLIYLHLDYWTSSFPLPVTCSLPLFSWLPRIKPSRNPLEPGFQSRVFTLLGFQSSFLYVQAARTYGSSHLPSVQAQAVSLGPVLRCRLRTCFLRNALALKLFCWVLWYAAVSVRASCVIPWL